MKQITTQTDVLTKKNVIHRIADVPGGVSLTIAYLPAGAVISEATPLSAPSLCGASCSGKRIVCKSAEILSGSTTTDIKVASVTNPFKVGDFLCAKEDGKAYVITEIEVSEGVATLTVGTAIDADVDGWVYEAKKEETTDGSTFANQPDAILLEAFEVPTDTMVIVVGDALLFAVVREDSIAPAYLAKLGTIKEAKY
jgi:hypothetical protein